MGSESSVVVFDVTEWEEVGETRFCTIIRHRITRQQLEKYTINMPSSFLEKDVQIYKARKNNLNGWIPVLYHYRESNSGPCGGSNYCVITQRFTRLSETKRKFSQTQGLEMLSDALHGFSTLVSQFGYFNVTAGTIALNDKGGIRVWFNENFASNQKTFDRHEKLDCNTIIASIVKIIAQRVQTPNFSILFQKYQDPKFNFASANSLLTDYKIHKLAAERRQRLKLQSNHISEPLLRNRISTPICSKREQNRQSQQVTQKSISKNAQKTDTSRKVEEKGDQMTVQKSEYRVDMFQLPKAPVRKQMKQQAKHEHNLSLDNNKSLFQFEMKKTTSIRVLEPYQIQTPAPSKQQELKKILGKQNRFSNRKIPQTVSKHHSFSEYLSPRLEINSCVIQEEESNQNSIQTGKGFQGKLGTEQTKSRQQSCHDSICSKSGRVIEKNSSLSSLHSQIRSHKYLFTRRSGMTDLRQIKRIDSVFLLGVADSIAPQQQQFVTIESTILRS